MKILGFDVGSSSIKAGIVRNGKIIGRPVRAAFATHFDGVRAEVDPASLLKAMAAAVRQIGNSARNVDAIGLSVMSPAWVAMDKSGRALTPLITHQDRRSVKQAHQIEDRVGKRRHLHITGNRPFPGGISSTTLAWYIHNDPALIRRADLLGHLNTFLHRHITAQRVIDPSNASFTGLYETVKQGGWSELLCKSIGVSSAKLPQVIESNVIGGKVTNAAAHQFGLTAGTPMMAGMVDTSSAMLLTGAAPGQLLNISGSTDVLGLCTATPHPHENLLTRALGVGPRWMSVATLAAAGSAIAWMKDQFFRDLSDDHFYKQVRKLAASDEDSTVIFEPYLAGQRTSIDQKTAAFTGLTLSTTRDQLLHAVIDALAKASGARLKLLSRDGTKIHPNVVVSGGGAKSLHSVLHRQWPGHWKFKTENEASLRGVGAVTPE